MFEYLKNHSSIRRLEVGESDDVQQLSKKMKFVQKFQLLSKLSDFGSTILYIHFISLQNFDLYITQLFTLKYPSRIPQKVSLKHKKITVVCEILVTISGRSKLPPSGVQVDQKTLVYFRGLNKLSFAIYTERTSPTAPLMMISKNFDPFLIWSNFISNILEKFVASRI